MYDFGASLAAGSVAPAAVTLTTVAVTALAARFSWM
jgi:hypothetical protein